MNAPPNDTDMWLAELPPRFERRSLKRLGNIVGGSTPKSGVESFWDGAIAWVTPADLGKGRSPYIEGGTRSITRQGYDSCSAELVPRESLLVSCRAPIGTLGIASRAVCTNQGCKSLVPNSSANTKYVYYSLSVSSDLLNVFGRGTTFLELSSAELGAFTVAVPSLEEQTQIAKFLDYETAKTDALIEKQEQLIALLNEKRQAVISHAVTKGLNPDAPMRDSGVEWLGEIPAHWEVVPVKHALRIDNGPRLPINRIERAEMEGPYPYWGPTGVLDHIDHFRYDGERVIIGEDGDHFLKFAIWPMTHLVSGKFNVNNHAHVLAGTARCSAKWFHYAFLHRDIGGDVIAQGVSRLKLTREGLSKLLLAVPPTREQELLICHMEPLIARVELASTTSARQIALLKERRTALISAAVTGKIDVRNWTPPTDDKAEAA